MVILWCFAVMSWLVIGRKRNVLCCIQGRAFFKVKVWCGSGCSVFHIASKPMNWKSKWSHQYSYPSIHRTTSKSGPNESNNQPVLVERDEWTSASAYRCILCRVSGGLVVELMFSDEIFEMKFLMRFLGWVGFG